MGTNVKLPPKAPGALSVIHMPGIAGIGLEEIERRVTETDMYLPDWGKEGMRNGMALRGHCTGLVSPLNPVNPMQDDAEINERNQPREPFIAFGSYIWFKVAELKPVISKDELEAYIYKLIARATSYNFTDVLEAPPVSRLTLKESTEAAKRRLVLAAPVTVSFHDVVLDVANELLLCDGGNKVVTEHIRNLFSSVLAGRRASDTDIIAVADENTPVQEPVPVETQLSTGIMEPVEEKLLKIKSDSVRGYLKKISGTELPETALAAKSLEDRGVAGMTHSIMAGVLTVLGCEHEFEEWCRDVKYAAEEMLRENPKSIKAGNILKTLSAVQTAAADIEEDDLAPSVGKFSFQDGAGTKVGFPSVTDESGIGVKELHDNVLDIIACSGNTGVVLPALTSLAGVTRPPVRLQSVTLNMVVAGFDVKVQISEKGTRLSSINNGSPLKGLVPLKVGVMLPDVVDRVDALVGIVQELHSNIGRLYVKSDALAFMCTVLRCMIAGEEKNGD